MIDIRFDTSNLPRLEQMPATLRRELGRAVSRTAQEGAVFMKKELARHRIAATSLLINSVSAEAVDALTWRFGPHVEYAWYIYKGRRPGGRMPPLAAIRAWMRAKRLGNDRRSAWAIARKIQQAGIKARDYVTPTVDFAQRRLNELGTAAVQTATGGG